MAFKMIFNENQPQSDNVFTRTAAMNNEEAQQKRKIIIKSVPKEYDDKGIYNMCSTFGKVLGVRSIPYENFSIYFVDFQNTSESERAIREINSNTKHRTMHADFCNNSKGADSSRGADRSGDGSSRNSNFNDQPKKKIDMTYRKFQGPFSDPVTDFQVPKQREMVTDSDYEESQLKFTDPNRDYVNINLKNSSQIRRPNVKQQEETEKYRNRNLARQTNGYHNNPEISVPSPKTGPCLNCQKSCNFVCERCKTFYCSRNCQSEDWPVHKLVCNVMPELIELRSSNARIQERMNNGHASEEHNNYQNNHNSKPKTNGVKESTTSRNPNNKSPNKNRSEENLNTSQPQNRSHNPQPGQTNGYGNATVLNHEMKKMAVATTNETPAVEKREVQLVPMPKSGANVTITAVISYNIVYIRPMDKQSDAEYCKILQDVLLYAAKGAKPIKKLPERGDLVLANFQNTGFYRAIVVKVRNEDEIYIAFIDFGNTDTKRMDELLDLKPELQSLRRHAIRVVLNGVEDGPRHNDVLDYLTGLSDEFEPLKIRYDGDYDRKLGVELVQIKTNDSINRKINEIISVAGAEGDNNKIIMIADVPKRVIPEGENVEVLITDNNAIGISFLSCAIPEDLESFSRLSMQINEYCAKLPPQVYTPRLNEACLFKYKGNWYRGGCIELMGDGNITLMCLDHGNMQLVSIDSIRKMPSAFATQNCLCVSCLVNEIPDKLNAVHVEKLKEIFSINKTVLVDYVHLMTTSDDDDDDDNNHEDSAEGELVNALTVKRVHQYFKNLSRASNEN